LGAATLSLLTFNPNTLSPTTPFIAKLSIDDTQDNDTWNNVLPSEPFFSVIQSVIMPTVVKLSIVILNFVMLSAIMQNVIMPGGIMSSVVAPLLLDRNVSKFSPGNLLLFSSKNTSQEGKLECSLLESIYSLV
jgi:hypothetical protein